MRYPFLSPQTQHQETVDVFLGYNRNLRIGPGEFYDMKNLSSDCFPVLSPRRRRSEYVRDPNLRGIISKERLCYVSGSDFVIGEERYPMDLSDSEKQLISMGAYVIILPDKCYINTAHPEDRGSMEAAVTASQVKLTLCSAEGEDYTPSVGTSAPEAPALQQLWLDTGEETLRLKRYGVSGWVDISPTYVKFSAPGLGSAFREGDGIRIRGIRTKPFDSFNAVHTLQAVGEGYVVIPGILENSQTLTESVTLERRMPEMDFVTESGNRLWGCRYGFREDGQQVNEIYACKLGDFRNWNCFQGLSTDSYAASCGTDGPFTGAVTFLDGPIFFKENCMHRVFGSFPANFRILTATCRGVRKGSHNSLAVVGQSLYYQSPGGICVYDGSQPVEISAPLGSTRYRDASAGAVGNKYYISMADEEGGYHLFVYDTARNLWHKEDDLKVSAFTSFSGQLYALEQGSGRILALLGSQGAEEAPFRWMAETGEIGITSPDMKYISRLTVRLSLDVGTEVRFYARYDFSEEWEPLFALRSSSLRSFSIPIKTRRCDFMKVRIEGDGGARIYSLTKTIEEGSDIS